MKKQPQKLISTARTKKAAVAAKAAARRAEREAKAEAAAKAAKNESSNEPGDVSETLSKVRVGKETVSHTQSYESAGTFGDSSMNTREGIFQDFKAKLKINVTKWSREEVEFDLVGVEPSLANALRRIMLAEIPSMAIEEVHIVDNTSLIPDEILAHRLGLIPIAAHPDDFEWRSVHGSSEVLGNEGLKFAIDVTCTKKSGAVPQSDRPEDLYLHSSVYASDMTWQPVGNQSVVYGEKGISPGPLHPNILIAKLRPGQRIRALCIVEKGLGKTHAKWSPVSTASYRLMPEISFSAPIRGEEAVDFVPKCPSGVFDIEDGGAVVSNPLACTMCRECVRDPKYESRVNLGRVKNHFLFRVESCAMMSAGEIVTKSMAILQRKLALAGHAIVNGGTSAARAAEEEAAAAAAAAAAGEGEETQETQESQGGDTQDSAAAMEGVEGTVETVTDE